MGSQGNGISLSRYTGLRDEQLKKVGSENGGCSFELAPVGLFRQG